MTRYTQDIKYELSGVEARIMSNRRSAGTTDKALTAQIADATLPALERQREALLKELETAPERPLQTYARSFKFNERTTPLSPEELAQLEIPDFLKRYPEK